MAGDPIADFNVPDCGLVIADAIDPGDCCRTTIVPWGCDEAIRCRLSADENAIFTDAELLSGRAWATDQLDRLTGHQFGLRRFCFAPCTRWCLCRCDPCSCCDYNTLDIPHANICYLTKVVHGGVAQDLSNYLIHATPLGTKYLVRTDDDWPTEQCLTNAFTENVSGSGDPADGWFVEYVHGTPAPPLSNDAIAELAIQYLFLCASDAGKCERPDGTTSIVRQGVTYTLDNERGALTGLEQANAFVESVNPKGLSKSATLLSPATTARTYVINNKC